MRPRFWLGFAVVIATAIREQMSGESEVLSQTVSIGIALFGSGYRLKTFDACTTARFGRLEEAATVEAN